MPASRPSSSFRRTAAVVFALGLGVQALYLLDSRGDPSFSVPIVDAGSYHEAATRFARGEPLAPGAFWQPPMFPAVLGLVYRVTGPSVLAARLLLAVIAGACCVMLAWLGGVVFSRRTGLVAGVMLAVYGPYVFYATRLLPVGLAIALNLLAFVLWVRTCDPTNVGNHAGTRRRTPRPLMCLLIGIIIGAAILTVPNSGVLAAVLAGVWLYHAIRRPTTSNLRTILIASVMLLLGTFLPVGAVAWRNRAVSGESVLISTNGGINFFLGNNPRRDETIAIRPGEPWQRFARQNTRTPGDTREPAFRSRAQQSRYFLGEAMRYVREKPASFAVGLAHKAMQLINAREIPRNVDPYVHRDYSHVLSALMWRAGSFGFPFGLLAPLAVLGLLVGAGRSPTRAESQASNDGTDASGTVGLASAVRMALIAFPIAYGLSVAMFFVTARYRLPLIPFVILFAAQGLVWSWDQLTGPRAIGTNRRRRTIALAGFAVMLIIANLSVRSATDSINFKGELLRSVGQAHTSGNRLEQAETMLADALQVDPTSADGRCKLAFVVALRGDTERAESLLMDAQRLDPAAPEPLWLLGDLRRIQGDRTAARVAFEQAISLDPLSPQAHAGLGALDQGAGHLESAAEHYRTALWYIDNPGPWLIRLGDTLTALERYVEAIESYRRGLLLVDADAETLNRIAWLLATCPNPELRDCRRAIEIARHVCDLTSHENAAALDTLAAGYAECGQVDLAIVWVTKAIHLAEVRGDENAAAAFRARLALYRGLRP